jgi:ParB family chromosome partitioning protein
MEPDKSRSRSKAGGTRKRANERNRSTTASTEVQEGDLTSADTSTTDQVEEKASRTATDELAPSVAPSGADLAGPAVSASDKSVEPETELPAESAALEPELRAESPAPEAVRAPAGGSADSATAVGVADDAGPAAADAEISRTAAGPTETDIASSESDDGGLLPVPGASFAEIPVDHIVPNTRQPRQVFDEEELDELAASIREVGVLQPVVVRPLPGAGADGAQFELIMGERRWRASQQAGNDTIPAIIRETGDGDLLRDALLENLHRANLNPLEEAAAYQQLLEDFGCTHDELATRIVRSRPQISNTLRLLKLPPLVQRRVAAGVLSAGHARALLGLSDGAAMERLAQKIVAEGLSVRATEEIVALGDEPVAPEMRRRPRAGAHAEDLNRLATRLADRLDTRVKVNLGQRKGRIAIEFASVEDLNRILDVLAPGEDHIAPTN